jgi:hypothetical protein
MKTKNKLKYKSTYKTKNKHKNKHKNKPKYKNINKTNQRGGVIKLAPSLKQILLPIISSSHEITDAKIDSLIIETLFKKVTDLRVISDKSKYSFVFEATTSDSFLIDTRDETVMSSTDKPENENKGKPLRKFCIKISFVTDENPNEEYNYSTLKKNNCRKRTSTSDSVHNEVALQRKIYYDFACVRSNATFVPDVIAYGIFSHDWFENHKMYFKSQKIVSNEVCHVFDTINYSNFRVAVILMEYFDTKEFKPTEELTGLFVNGTFNIFNSAFKTAMITTAAQLVCVMGLGIILYDSHWNNILATTSGENVCLIDIGGALDIFDQHGNGYDKVVEFFEKMCDIALGIELDGRSSPDGLPEFPTIKNLCIFFGINFDPQMLSTVPKIKKIKKDLTKKFIDNLQFPDFRCLVENDDEMVRITHHALVMLAFLDFMVNRILFLHPKCQSGNTMISVYPRHDFKSFNNFVLDFNPDYSVDKVSRRTNNLKIVITRIREITRPCNSLCLMSIKPKSSDFRFSSSSMLKTSTPTVAPLVSPRAVSKRSATPSKRSTTSSRQSATPSKRSATSSKGSSDTATRKRQRL